MQKRTFAAIIAAFSLAMIALPASANHSWGGYHWARASNPFALKLGDNLSSGWDPYLAKTSTDWSMSSVLDTSIVGGRTAAQNCKPTLGRVEVCNSKYGRNGWLGIAQVWANGTHITQGTVKMNDTYFNTAPYNTSAWKNLVMCQEVGHTLGLDHQDEDMNNVPLGTCMDYSSNPTPNQHPNQHDYDELELIYAHLDSSTTLVQSSNGVAAQVLAGEPSDWGKQVKGSGKTAVFERDLGHNQKVFTFVVYSSTK
jgi:hypothetical protein